MGGKIEDQCEQAKEGGVCRSGVGLWGCLGFVRLDGELSVACVAELGDASGVGFVWCSPWIGKIQPGFVQVLDRFLYPISVYVEKIVVERLLGVFGRWQI